MLILLERSNMKRFDKNYEFRDEVKRKLFLLFPTIAFKRYDDDWTDKIEYRMYFGWFYFHFSLIIFQKEMFP